MNDRKDKKVRNNEFRQLVGVVVSNKMQKTLVVRVDRKVKHPLYKKVYTESAKMKVHCDDERMYPEGTKVTIVYQRPLSKEKSWRVLRSDN